MIAVVFALEFEGAVFSAKQTTRLCATTWFLGATGAGAGHSLQRKLDDIRPQLIVSAGFAGALQPDLRIGDLVLGLNYSDPGIVQKMVLSGLWHKGNVQTEAAIIEKAEDKRKLGEATGCLVGDMETRHLAETCGKYDIPMLSIRSISDAMNDDMPVPGKVLLNPETSRPDSMALFRHLVANPASVIGFNRLLKNAKIAQASLAKGLEEILPQALKLV